MYQQWSCFEISDNLRSYQRFGRHGILQIFITINQNNNTNENIDCIEPIVAFSGSFYFYNCDCCTPCQHPFRKAFVMWKNNLSCCCRVKADCRQTTQIWDGSVKVKVKETTTDKNYYIIELNFVKFKCIVVVQTLYRKLLFDHSKTVKTADLNHNKLNQMNYWFNTHSNTQCFFLMGFQNVWDDSIMKLFTWFYLSYFK